MSWMMSGSIGWSKNRYWMVVNAANNDKDWAWVNAVREAGS